MLVHPKDSRGRSCGGDLKIIDVTDATMEVECQKWT